MAEFTGPKPGPTALGRTGKAVRAPGPGGLEHVHGVWASPSRRGTDGPRQPGCRRVGGTV